jgi:SAM-dependent methyltransferase
LDPEISRKRLYAPVFQRWAKGLIRRLASSIAPSRSGPLRLLEVGCASGGILKAARDLGVAPVGVEVSPEAAAYGRREELLEIHIGLLEQLGFPAGSFDIVLLHDVIEHVPSPLNLLRECVRLLAGGGVLCLNTVNVESATARYAGWSFYLADSAGGHLVLFSPGTLKRYCKKLGLEVVAIETRGFRLVQREIDRPRMRWTRPFVRLAENLVHEVVKWTGRGHFVLLIARKP